MRKCVDAGAQKSLGVFEGEDVGRDAQPVLMGLVDDRAVKLRRELADRAVPVVHPNLDEVNLSGGELLHSLASVRDVRDPVGSFRPAGLGHGDAAACGAETRGVGDDFVAHLEGHVRVVLAQAHHHADSVVRLALQLLDEHLAIGRHVGVRVNDRRHDRLAAQVHTARAGRNLHLAGSAHLRETGPVNDEGGVLDGRAAIADDESGAFEDRHVCGLGCDRRRPRREEQAKRAEGQLPRPRHLGLSRIDASSSPSSGNGRVALVTTDSKYDNLVANFAASAETEK